jgi:hypothetical protein
MLPVVLLVIAAFCCTLAGFWYPAPPSAFKPHLGWLGVALYLWSLVFFRGH